MHAVLIVWSLNFLVSPVHCGLLLQSLVSYSFPRQYSPPFLGGGSSQSLPLICIPPHSAGQVDHGFQELQYPLTEIFYQLLSLEVYFRYFHQLKLERNVCNKNWLILLTRFSLLIYDGLDPPLKRPDLWPPASLVLPVVGGVSKPGTVETTARENAHKCEAVVIPFSDEGTSCFI